MLEYTTIVACTLNRNFIAYRVILSGNDTPAYNI
jgi:hypothetical protein